MREVTYLFITRILLLFPRKEKRGTEMNSPAKGRGLMGSKRNPKSPPQSSENPQSTANRRKKSLQRAWADVPSKEDDISPKPHQRLMMLNRQLVLGIGPWLNVFFLTKRLAPVQPLISGFVIVKEREEFLQECPKDLPTFSSPSPLSLHSLPSPSVPNERSDFGEAYVHQECSVSSVVPSLGGGINVDSEEFTSSAFSPQPWTSQSISNTLASEWSATELTEARGSPVLDEIDSVSDDDVCSPVTPTIGDFLDKEELPPSLHNGAAPPATIIVKTVCKFSETLPPWWSTFAGKSGIHLFRYSTKTPSAIQREIFLSYGGDLNIFVHCKTLPSELDIFKSIEISNVALNIDSIDKFCSWGVSIARALEQYRTCIGADLLELKDVWGNIPNSSVDKNPYQEERYSETCRSNSCSLLVSLGRPKRCGPCGKLLKSLKNRRCQLLSKEHHPSTPNIYLTYEQALQKLRIQHDDLRKKDFRIAYLEGKVKKLLDKEGVDLNRELSTDLANILANSKLTHAQEIFFREQLSCCGKADARAHRWHPYMIRLALHLQMTSRSAYEALRNSGAIKLPSSRTLFDYSHACKADIGISVGIIKMAKERNDKFEKAHQKFVSLMADEMHISKNLVYRQADGKLFGFVHLDKVEEEMQKLEEELKGGTEIHKPNLATKMLAFMIKGCTSSLKYVVASYPVSTLSKDMLYARTWNVISRLERAGIKVLTFVSDGCSVNRAFINMHTPVTELKSGVIFDTINFCSDDRRILYFVSDVAHLLKTVRNSFYGSGEGKTSARCMEIKGEKIVWKTIIRLYLTFKQCTFRKSFKLSSQNVFPNSYSIMKVKLAAEVLSDTVALDLEQQNWPSTTQTVDFIRKCNKFFDCLNGAHTSQHIRTRNANLKPYKQADDPRFKWLEEEFLGYLEDWESEVKMKFKPEEWSKKLITRQTLEGIEMSIKGITGAIRFLLKDGADFVNPRTFSQDHLEQHFSLQRAGGGGSSNPNAMQFANKQVSTSVQRDLGIKTRGNVTETQGKADISAEPLPKRARKCVPKKNVSLRKP